MFFFLSNFQTVLIETMNRKKFLIVSDVESSIDIIKQFKKKEIDGDDLSRTVVGFKFIDDWIESLMEKWKEFVEDITAFGDNDENVKDTNRTAADFIDDLIESLVDSWEEYVDEFSGSDDREVESQGYYKHNFT